ncbi:MAG: AMP-binding protein [Alphaproteobacteria bacterium]|nr:AMP-binding protein [Alphaproteobacteria bacterium]
MSAIATLFHHLTHSPHAPALRYQGQTWTFGDLLDRARAYAAGISALGVGQGDRVVCLLPACPELVVTLLGHYLLGVIHVPVNDRYGTVELGHILRDSGAVAVLTEAGSGPQAVIDALGPLPSLRHRLVLGEARGDEVDLDGLIGDARAEGPPAPADEDPALIIYTSGTTGPSKGVILSFRAVVAGIDALTRLWRWTPQDRLVLALPLFHVHGLCIGVHGVLLRGCHAELLPRFDAAEVIDAVGGGGTIFMGVPTMYRRLVAAMDAEPEAGAILARGRLFTSGSAALSASLFEAFQRHTGHRILERYGMSETLLTVSNPYPPEDRRPGTIGFPVPGCAVEVRGADGRRVEPGEVGEILIRGPFLMSGYWGLPGKTAESFDAEGWFRTGDMATMDPDGYVVHRGRASVDLLKSGGYRISAREIEEALADDPEIEEVAVLGAPDPDWGQRITAAVVPTRSAPQRSAEAWVARLQARLEGRLAAYKRPRAVLLLEELPRNALGKVQKHRILTSPPGAG